MPSGPVSHYRKTHLLALVLARSLEVELPNTRQTCLNDISNPVLSNEVSSCVFGTTRALHIYLSIFTLLIARRNYDAARKCHD